LGEVWVAEDLELGREVGLKQIQERHKDNPDSRRRFLREAEITSRLRHPGIVPVYGLTQDRDGHPCFAMNYWRSCRPPADFMSHAGKRVSLRFL
jgi:serine/threonine protein kinase